MGLRGNFIFLVSDRVRNVSQNRPLKHEWNTAGEARDLGDISCPPKAAAEKKRSLFSLRRSSCLDVVLRPGTPIFVSGLRLKLLSRMAEDKEKETEALMILLSRSIRNTKSLPHL